MARHESDEQFWERLSGQMAEVAVKYADHLQVSRPDLNAIGEGEILVALEAGTVHVLSEYREHTGPIGIFALRSGRIQTFRRGFGRITSGDFDVRRVTSVDYTPGWQSDELKLGVAGDVLTYRWVKPRAAGAAFQAYVQKMQVDAPLPRPRPDHPKAVTPPASVSSEIEALARLRQAGAITDDEFARAKRRILG